MELTSAMTEKRLTDVETAIAFQEKTIGDLSDVICRQQEEIDRLKAQLMTITEQMTHGDNGPLPGETLPANEKPPHY